MYDVLNELEAWLAQGSTIAMATVISTWGSSPRQPGSKMVVTSTGGIAGSVSAGCVENAVIEECSSVLSSGMPKLLTYGIADKDAWDVGLTCGGKIHVFVEPFAAVSPIFPALRRHLTEHKPAVVVSVIKGKPDQVNHKLLISQEGAVEGTLVLGELQADVVANALDQLARGTSAAAQIDEDTILFFEAYPTIPRLIVVGAVHIAEYLVTMANMMGFHTVVVDPRAAFANEQRFPHAQQLIKAWPQEALPALMLDDSCYVVTLSHDAKIDDPAIEVALASKARYVGALGSRATNQARLERLRETGLSDEQLGRLHSPVGLPLGGRSPAEIALSAMAQVVQTRYRA